MKLKNKNLLQNNKVLKSKIAELENKITVATLENNLKQPGTVDLEKLELKQNLAKANTQIDELKNQLAKFNFRTGKLDEILGAQFKQINKTALPSFSSLECSLHV